MRLLIYENINILGVTKYISQINFYLCFLLLPWTTKGRILVLPIIFIQFKNIKEQKSLTRKAIYRPVI